MNQVDLQKLVEEILLKHFHLPFRHEVKINSHMATAGGRHFLNDHYTDTNGYFLDEKYRSDLMGIIEHELAHYRLHLVGLGYQHRNRDFRNLLTQVGGSCYMPDIGLRRKQVKNYLYGCEDCHFRYPRVRKVNTRRYRCGKYGGRLKLVRRNK